MDKDLAQRIGRRIGRQAVNKYFQTQILNTLPARGNKQIGKLRREIATGVTMEPEAMSNLLQSMKRHGMVRCYKNRWRQA